MLIFTKTAALHHFITSQKSKGKSIGFVPTMGALHQGHLSLVRASKADNDITVCSLFVNPTQFDVSEDLQKYPRNHDVDMAMLSEMDCEVTFLPTVLEVYPIGLNTKVNVDLGGLDTRFEGKFRPGHFDGMMEVVNRLLQITVPDRLFMGQKDYQQQLIVSKMIAALGIDVELISCPTVREEDGLAMSSRNRRLSDDYLSKANNIQRSLQDLAAKRGKESLEEAIHEAVGQMKVSGLRPEYLAVCRRDELTKVSDWSDEDVPLVAVTAAWAGNIRLIDNILF